jgi:hypothetical protein
MAMSVASTMSTMSLRHYGKAQLRDEQVNKCHERHNVPARETLFKKPCKPASLYGGQQMHQRAMQTTKASENLCLAHWPSLDNQAQELRRPLQLPMLIKIPHKKAVHLYLDQLSQALNQLSQAHSSSLP